MQHEWHKRVAAVVLLIGLTIFDLAAAKRGTQGRFTMRFTRTPLDPVCDPYRRTKPEGE